MAELMTVLKEEYKNLEDLKDNLLGITPTTLSVSYKDQIKKCFGHKQVELAEFDDVLVDPTITNIPMVLGAVAATAYDCTRILRDRAMISSNPLYTFSNISKNDNDWYDINFLHSGKSEND